MEHKEIFVIKADGTKEIFNERKLLHSLRNSGAAETIANEVMRHLAREVKNGMTTREIYRHAFYLLHKFEQSVALRYSLRRSLQELGPSGFPFEKFVAEIYRRQGYTVLTDQMVQGGCVEHEVDVVAYNDQKLVMMEVKFHNQPGLKSDLKVALYVKARYDDLKKAEFEYGGKKRKLDEGWLITNTKFTHTAVRYAQCEGLPIVGWNYPQKNSLVQMIEKSGLHPLTCLTTLNGMQKKQLMDKGIVLCNAIYDNPTILDSINVFGEDANSVITESRLLCPII
jgi:hypothetical protein